MVKFIIFITKIILTSILAVLFSSCNFNGIKGSGNVTTENRLVNGNFKSIEVNNGIDAVIEQSKNTSITVQADDNLQKEIVTNIRNGVLIITCKYNSYINVKSKKVIVKLPIIENLIAHSGSSINSKNLLKSNNININASSGANIKVTIESEKAICESSSGSNINIKGKTIDFETASSSGSNIDSKDLLSNNIIASASSGSTITIHPLLSLKAEASSRGYILYNNTPKTITKKSSSGGSIKKQ